MPGPNADSIIKARWYLGIVLNAVASVLLVAAVVWAAVRIQPFRYHHRMASTGFAPTADVFSLDYFAIPIATGAVALAMLLISRFGLRWIVAVPKPNCPGCGYDLSKPEGPRCPECGLQIRASEPSP